MNFTISYRFQMCWIIARLESRAVCDIFVSVQISRKALVKSWRTSAANENFVVLSVGAENLYFFLRLFGQTKSRPKTENIENEINPILRLTMNFLPTSSSFKKHFRIFFGALFGRIQIRLATKVPQKQEYQIQRRSGSSQKKVDKLMWQSFLQNCVKEFSEWK